RVRLPDPKSATLSKRLDSFPTPSSRDAPFEGGSEMSISMIQDLLERRVKARATNEEIVQVAEAIDFVGRVPLPCECGDRDCRGFARMNTDVFRIVLTQPTWFIEGAAHGARYIVVDGGTGQEIT